MLGSGPFVVPFLSYNPWPTRYSWSHLPTKLLELESRPQGVLLGETSPKCSYAHLSAHTYSHTCMLSCRWSCSLMYKPPSLDNHHRKGVCHKCCYLPLKTCLSGMWHLFSLLTWNSAGDNCENRPLWLVPINTICKWVWFSFQHTWPFALNVVLCSFESA